MEFFTPTASASGYYNTSWTSWALSSDKLEEFVQNDFKEQAIELLKALRNINVKYMPALPQLKWEMLVTKFILMYDLGWLRLRQPVSPLAIVITLV